jgi:hypothetical protein
METGYSLSDVAAVTGNKSDGIFGEGMGFFWIFALLLLPGLFGGGAFGGGRGDAVTESALCNSMNFNALESSVGRIADQINSMYTGIQNGICQSGYETLRNFNTTQMQIAQGNSAIQQQISSCCCGIENKLDNLNYNNAMNTAAINENTTAQVQKVLDAICGNRMADMQNQINQLQLQSALCGVVRYPNQTAYFAQNPFFGSTCNCSGNI